VDLISYPGILKVGTTSASIGSQVLQFVMSSDPNSVSERYGTLHFSLNTFPMLNIHLAAMSNRKSVIVEYCNTVVTVVSLVYVMQSSFHFSYDFNPY
jgi:hypothetical protein